MRITDVLREKGGTVVTVAPDGSVSDLLDLLAEHGVGALVVADAAGGVAGIVSERDVVRSMQRHGADLLAAPVREIMTTSVYTASPDTDLEALLRTMTDRRFRHVPVVEDGSLVGIVSIGDVVKYRIDHLEAERDQLTAYISG
jgi:CBS domain-containing protein